MNVGIKCCKKQSNLLLRHLRNKERKFKRMIPNTIKEDIKLNASETSALNETINEDEEILVERVSGDEVLTTQSSQVKCLSENRLTNAIMLFSDNRTAAEENIKLSKTKNSNIDVCDNELSSEVGQEHTEISTSETRLAEAHSVSSDVKSKAHELLKVTESIVSKYNLEMMSMVSHINLEGGLYEDNKNKKTLNTNLSRNTFQNQFITEITAKFQNSKHRVESNEIISSEVTLQKCSNYVWNMLGEIEDRNMSLNLQEGISHCQNRVNNSQQTDTVINDQKNQSVKSDSKSGFWRRRVECFYKQREIKVWTARSESGGNSNRNESNSQGNRNTSSDPVLSQVSNPEIMELNVDDNSNMAVMPDNSVNNTLDDRVGVLSQSTSELRTDSILSGSEVLGDQPRRFSKLFHIPSFGDALSFESDDSQSNEDYPFLSTSESNKSSVQTVTSSESPGQAESVVSADQTNTAEKGDISAKSSPSVVDDDSNSCFNVTDKEPSDRSLLAKSYLEEKDTSEETIAQNVLLRAKGLKNISKSISTEISAKLVTLRSESVEDKAGNKQISSTTSKDDNSVCDEDDDIMEYLSVDSKTTVDESNTSTENDTKKRSVHIKDSTTGKIDNTNKRLENNTVSQTTKSLYEISVDETDSFQILSKDSSSANNLEANSSKSRMGATEEWNKNEVKMQHQSSVSVSSDSNNKGNVASSSETVKDLGKELSDTTDNRKQTPASWIERLHSGKAKAEESCKTLSRQSSSKGSFSEFSNNESSDSEAENRLMIDCNYDSDHGNVISDGDDDDDCRIVENENSSTASTCGTVQQNTVSPKKNSVDTVHVTGTFVPPMHQTSKTPLNDNNDFEKQRNKLIKHSLELGRVLSAVQNVKDKIIEDTQTLNVPGQTNQKDTEEKSPVQDHCYVRNESEYNNPQAVQKESENSVARSQDKKHVEQNQIENCGSRKGRIFDYEADWAPMSKKSLTYAQSELQSFDGRDLMVYKPMTPEQKKAIFDTYMEKGIDAACETHNIPIENLRELLKEYFESKLYEVRKTGAKIVSSLSHSGKEEESMKTKTVTPKPQELKSPFSGSKEIAEKPQMEHTSSKMIEKPTRKSDEFKMLDEHNQQKVFVEVIRNDPIEIEKNIQKELDTGDKLADLKQLEIKDEDFIVNKLGRRLYSYDFKKKVVSLADKYGDTAVAAQINFDRKVIYKWRVSCKNFESNKSSKQEDNKNIKTTNKEEKPNKGTTEEFKRKQFRYSDNLKIKLVHLAKSYGVTDIHKQYGVKKTSLQLWHQRYADYKLDSYELTDKDLLELVEGAEHSKAQVEKRALSRNNSEPVSLDIVSDSKLDNVRKVSKSIMMHPTENVCLSSSEAQFENLDASSKNSVLETSPLPIYMPGHSSVPKPCSIPGASSTPIHSAIPVIFEEPVTSKVLTGPAEKYEVVNSMLRRALSKIPSDKHSSAPSAAYIHGGNVVFRYDLPTASDRPSVETQDTHENLHATSESHHVSSVQHSQVSLLNPTLLSALNTTSSDSRIVSTTSIVSVDSLTPPAPPRLFRGEIRPGDSTENETVNDPVLKNTAVKSYKSASLDPTLIPPPALQLMKPSSFIPAPPALHRYGLVTSEARTRPLSVSEDNEITPVVACSTSTTLFSDDSQTALAQTDQVYSQPSSSVMVTQSSLTPSVSVRTEPSSFPPMVLRSLSDTAAATERIDSGNIRKFSEDSALHTYSDTSQTDYSETLGENQSKNDINEKEVPRVLVIPRQKVIVAPTGEHANLLAAQLRTQSHLKPVPKVAVVPPVSYSSASHLITTASYLVTTTATISISQATHPQVSTTSLAATVDYAAASRPIMSSTDKASVNFSHVHRPVTVAQVLPGKYYSLLSHAVTASTSAPASHSVLLQPVSVADIIQPANYPLVSDPAVTSPTFVTPVSSQSRQHILQQEALSTGVVSESFPQIKEEPQNDQEYSQALGYNQTISAASVSYGPGLPATAASLIHSVAQNIAASISAESLLTPVVSVASSKHSTVFVFNNEGRITNICEINANQPASRGHSTSCGSVTFTPVSQDGAGVTFTPVSQDRPGVTLTSVSQDKPGVAFTPVSRNTAPETSWNRKSTPILLKNSVRPLHPNLVPSKDTVSVSPRKTKTDYLREFGKQLGIEIKEAADNVRSKETVTVHNKEVENQNQQESEVANSLDQTPKKSESEVAKNMEQFQKIINPSQVSIDLLYHLQLLEQLKKLKKPERSSGSKPQAQKPKSNQSRIDALIRNVTGRLKPKDQELVKTSMNLEEQTELQTPSNKSKRTKSDSKMVQSTDSKSDNKLSKALSSDTDSASPTKNLSAKDKYVVRDNSFRFSHNLKMKLGVKANKSKLSISALAKMYHISEKSIQRWSTMFADVNLDDHTLSKTQHDEIMAHKLWFKERKELGKLKTNEGKDFQIYIDNPESPSLENDNVVENDNLSEKQKTSDEHSSTDFTQKEDDTIGKKDETVGKKELREKSDAPHNQVLKKCLSDSDVSNERQKELERDISACQKSLSKKNTARKSTTQGKVSSKIKRTASDISSSAFTQSTDNKAPKFTDSKGPEKARSDSSGSYSRLHIEKMKMKETKKPPSPVFDVPLYIEAQDPEITNEERDDIRKSWVSIFKERDKRNGVFEVSHNTLTQNCEESVIPVSALLTKKSKDFPDSPDVICLDDVPDKPNSSVILEENTVDRNVCRYSKDSKLYPILGDEKHSLEFKLKIVKEAQESGCENAAKWYSLDIEDVKKWYNAMEEDKQLQFRLSVVKCAKAYGIKHAERLYSVGEQKITDWLDQENIDNSLTLNETSGVFEEKTREQREREGLQFERLKNRDVTILRPRFDTRRASENDSRDSSPYGSDITSNNRTRTRMGGNSVSFATKQNFSKVHEVKSSSSKDLQKEYLADVEGDIGAMPRIVKQKSAKTTPKAGADLEIASTWKQVQEYVNEPDKSKDKKYSPEFKARIIKLCVQKGQKVVAKEHKLPFNKISRWRLKAKTEGLNTNQTDTVKEKTENDSPLVMKINLKDEPKVTTPVCQTAEPEKSEFSESFKKEVVRYARKHGFIAAAREYKVGNPRILSWIRHYRSYSFDLTESKLVVTTPVKEPQKSTPNKIKSPRHSVGHSDSSHSPKVKGMRKTSSYSENIHQDYVISKSSLGKDTALKITLSPRRKSSAPSKASSEEGSEGSEIDDFEEVATWSADEGDMEDSNVIEVSDGEDDDVIEITETDVQSSSNKEKECIVINENEKNIENSIKASEESKMVTTEKTDVEDKEIDSPVRQKRKELQLESKEPIEIDSQDDDVHVLSSDVESVYDDALPRSHISPVKHVSGNLYDLLETDEADAEAHEQFKETSSIDKQNNTKEQEIASDHDNVNKQPEKVSFEQNKDKQPEKAPDESSKDTALLQFDGHDIQPAENDETDDQITELKETGKEVVIVDNEKMYSESSDKGTDSPSKSIKEVSGEPNDLNSKETELTCTIPEEIVEEKIPQIPYEETLMFKVFSADMDDFFTGSFEVSRPLSEKGNKLDSVKEEAGDQENPDNKAVKKKKRKQTADVEIMGNLDEKYREYMFGPEILPDEDDFINEGIRNEQEDEELSDHQDRTEEASLDLDEKLEETSEIQERKGVIEEKKELSEHQDSAGKALNAVDEKLEKTSEVKEKEIYEDRKKEDVEPPVERQETNEIQSKTAVNQGTDETDIKPTETSNTDLVTPGKAEAEINSNILPSRDSVENNTSNELKRSASGSLFDNLFSSFSVPKVMKEMVKNGEKEAETESKSTEIETADSQKTEADKDAPNRNLFDLIGTASAVEPPVIQTPAVDEKQINQEESSKVSQTESKPRKYQLRSSSREKSREKTPEPPEPVKASFNLFGSLMKGIKLPSSLTLKSLGNDNPKSSEGECQKESTKEDIEDKQAKTDMEKKEETRDKGSRNLFDFLSPACEQDNRSTATEESGKSPLPNLFEAFKSETDIKTEPREVPESSPVPNLFDALKSSGINSDIKDKAEENSKPIPSPGTAFSFLSVDASIGKTEENISPKIPPKTAFKFLSMPVNFGLIAKLGMAKLKETKSQSKETEETTEKQADTESAKSDQQTDSGAVENDTSTNETSEVQETADELKEKDNAVSEATNIKKDTLENNKLGNDINDLNNAGSNTIDIEDSEMDKNGEEKVVEDESARENMATEVAIVDGNEDDEDELYNSFAPQKVVLILDISKKHGIEFASTSFGLPPRVIVNWIIEKDRKHRKVASSHTLEEKLTAVKQSKESDLDEVAAGLNVSADTIKSWRDEVAWLLDSPGVVDLLLKWSKIENGDISLDNDGKVQAENASNDKSMKGNQTMNDEHQNKDENSAEKSNTVKDHDHEIEKLPDILNFAKTTHPKDYSVEQKAIILLLLDRYGVNDVNKKLGISIKTLWGWKNRSTAAWNYIRANSGLRTERKPSQTSEKIPEKVVSEKASCSPVKVEPLSHTVKVKEEVVQPVEHKPMTRLTSEKLAAIEKMERERELEAKKLMAKPLGQSPLKGYRQISPTKIPGMLQDVRKLPTKDFTLDQRVAIVKLVDLYGVRTVHKQFRIPAGSIWNWQHSKTVMELARPGKGVEKAKRNLEFDESEVSKSKLDTIETVMERVKNTLKTLTHLQFNSHQKSDAVCLVNYYGIDSVFKSLKIIPRGTLWNWCHNKYVMRIVERKMELLQKADKSKSPMKTEKLSPRQSDNQTSGLSHNLRHSVDKKDLTQQWLTQFHSVPRKRRNSESSSLTDSGPSKEKRSSTEVNDKDDFDFGNFSDNSECSEHSDHHLYEEIDIDLGESFNTTSSSKFTRSSSGINMTPSVVSSVSIHSGDFEEIPTDDEQSRSSRSRTSALRKKNVNIITHEIKKPKIEQSETSSVDVGRIEDLKDEIIEVPELEVVEFKTTKNNRMLVSYKVVGTKNVYLLSGEEGNGVEKRYEVFKE